MISLTASSSRPDEVFGRDRPSREANLPPLNTLLKLQVTPTPGLVQHRIVWRLSEARGDLSARAPHEFLMRSAAHDVIYSPADASVAPSPTRHSFWERPSL